MNIDDKYKVYMFWTNDEEMPEIRKLSIIKFKQVSQADVFLFFTLYLCVIAGIIDKF